MHIHGPHVEQNHASLKAIVEDDKTRSLEQNIIQVMRRTGLLLQKRQSLKYKWQVEGANALQKMDVIRRGHLTKPRNELSQRPYHFWVEQYELYPSYMVEDAVRDGVNGAIIKHTSQSNEGYFIPDVTIGGEGEECPCAHEWASTCGCCHFIAKRIFRGEQPFCKKNIHSWHLFHVELPTSKSGNASNPGLPTTEYFQEDSSKDVHVPSPSSLPPAQSETESLKHSEITETTAVPASALKVKPSNNISDRVSTAFAAKKPANISYHQLLAEGNKLANLSSHMNNEHIHVVYSMLVGMNMIVENGDHDPANHKGGPLEVFVKQLVALGQTGVTAQAGDPKAKNCNAHGPPTTHRLGSSKSSMTGTGSGKKKVPPKCTFCGGNGCGYFHSSKTVCPLKNGYGECIDMKKTHNAIVGDDIESIFRGNHVFSDALTLGDFSNHHRIDDDLPKGTKSVQIKAFMVTTKRFLLCTCFNVGGTVLQSQEGSKLVVYENIFISEKAITRNLVKCDYIFYKSLLEATEEQCTTGRTSTHAHHNSGVLESGDDESRSHKRSRTEEESAA